MIYLVTGQKELFENPEYEVISVEESLKLLDTFSMVQFDTETKGKDCHIGTLLCAQFGNKTKDIQIVVDCLTIDIRNYKKILENKFIIGQNLKFDLQWLYNYDIVPRKVYDTMIVEQLLYLGFPSIVKLKDLDSRYNMYEECRDKEGKPYYKLSYALNAIARRRLNINLDKSVRGEIIWRGLDTRVIKYAAADVMYLEDIMWSQVKDCKAKGCLKGAQLECDFVPVIAYLEWSGIKLDESLWKRKMNKDLKHLEEAKEALNKFVLNHPVLKSSFTHIEPPGLFEEYNHTEPIVDILWTSSSQVIKVAKTLGFDTKVQNKKGEDTESVIEKHLKKQKGICDEFLTLYFGKGEEGDEDYFAGHQGSAKVVSSFGQGHLDAINPKTGRIHTIYKQLGADTGRMSSGSKEPNEDLAKFKGLPSKCCKYPNMQQLPSDAETRACFVSEKGNKWISCDYSAIESRLGADIYKEKSMIDEFLYGSGDLHSLTAWMVFNKECRALGCTSVADVKKKAPHWRTKAKPIEFSQQFGGSEFAIQNAMGCSIKEATEFRDSYAKGFPGIAKFKQEGSKNVRTKGYVVLCPTTGHKTYWWDNDLWKERQASFTKDFWENYSINHKGTGDDIAQMVSTHFKAASKWDRKSLNSPTQGLGAIILKESQIRIFNWIVDNGYFSKILLCNLTHDECNWEYPEALVEFPKIVQNNMEETAAKYCKSLPIPAEPTVSDHWIH